MKQRLFVALIAVGLLAGIVAGPVLAGAGGVQRYQFATTSYTLTVLDTFIHTFVVTLNPCDDTIAITGSTPLESGYYTIETVSGTLAGDVISFSSTYDGPYNPGFIWSGSFPVAGGPLTGPYPGTVIAGPTTSSSYKNHGDFVSSMGGGPEAAHSCIGKPITSKDDTLSVADSEGADPDKAKDKTAQQSRLVATLEAVLAKLHNSHAIEAIQRHVDRIKGAGPETSQGAEAGNDGDQQHPKHPKKPASSASGNDHSNNGNHSGKPKP